jgi:multicomponent Na+:H+ antiporter subunit F
MNDYTIVEVASLISLMMLTAAMFIVFIRLQKGPSLPDRIVALDVIASIFIGLIAAYSIYTNTAVLLDAAVIAAVITFLGTVAVARYLERR